MRSRLAVVVRHSGNLWAIWVGARYGVATVSTGSPIADGFLGALGAFVVTWMVAFLVRFSNAPVALYYDEKKRADHLSEQLQAKLSVVYDKAIRPCRDVVTYTGGSDGICFRLQVENTGATNIRNCEGWLNKIKQMPQLSPVKLFWIGMPTEKMSEDLPAKVPRYLQVCEITDFNRVIMATEGRVWPLGEDNIFKPGEYLFDIVINPYGIQAVDYKLRFNWTGDWKTAEVSHVE
jgi:hypothetical protein